MAGILFELRGLHKANSRDFGALKIIFVLITTIVIPIMFYCIANTADLTKFAFPASSGGSRGVARGPGPSLILGKKKEMTEERKACNNNSEKKRFTTFLFLSCLHSKFLRFSVRFERK